MWNVECGVCVTPHPTFLFLITVFLHTPSKPSYRLSLLEILPVGIVEQSGRGEIKSSGVGINKALIGKHVDHIGHKHIVTSQVYYFLDSALYGQR